MADLSLRPVSVGVYTLLNVSALTSLLADGAAGLSDSPQQATKFPFVWVELQEEADERGMGTGGVPRVRIRVHVFSTYAGMKEAQDVLQVAIGLLKDQTPTVSGYAVADRMFYDEATTLPAQVLNGVKVHELVASFRVYVEEAA